MFVLSQLCFLDLSSECAQTLRSQEKMIIFFMLLYLNGKRKLWKKELLRTKAPHYRWCSKDGLWNPMAWLLRLRLTSLIFCPCQLEEITASHQLQGFGCKTCLPLFHRYTDTVVYLFIYLSFDASHVPSWSSILISDIKETCQEMNGV